MDAIIVLVIIIGVLVFIGRNARTRDLEAAEAGRLREHHRRLAEQNNLSDLIDVIHEHAATLSRKRRQMVFVDDYGKARTDQWDREVEYFIDNVVPDRILHWFDREFVADTVRDCIASYEGYPEDLGHGLIDGYRSDMTGVEFETFVADIFRDNGWEVQPTMVTGDQGIDLIARRNGLSIGVQCKRSASPVGNKAVQEAAAGRVHYGTSMAWVVSDADFTPSARQLSNTNGVSLLHYEMIPDLLEAM